MVHWGRDCVKPIFVQLWWSSPISFFYHGLINITLESRTFMSSNNWDPPFWSRIDRFLVSSNWEAKFTKVSQKRLQRICSDYFPILDCRDFHGGKRNFKFENMWLKS